MVNVGMRVIHRVAGTTVAFSNSSRTNNCQQQQQSQ